MSKHTPGPWIDDGNGFADTWDVSNSEHSICTVTTSRADARLIAAAPELLEALKIAKYEIVKLQGGFAGKACEQIAEAIAKAEGRHK